MTIKSNYYLGVGSSKQYKAELHYEKDSNPRGYYVTVYPVRVEDCEFYYSEKVDFSRAIARREYITVCVKEVKRASQKAQAEALELFKEVATDYFVNRGLHVKQCKREDCAKATEDLELEF